MNSIIKINSHALTPRWLFITGLPTPGNATCSRLAPLLSLAWPPCYCYLSIGPPAAVNAYLMAYNLASFLGWGYVLVKTVDHYIKGGSPETVYAQTGELTKWVQTGALLEIAHSALGFVRSPVGTTATQVFSRIMLVWGVMHLFPQPSVGSERATRGVGVGRCLDAKKWGFGCR